MSNNIILPFEIINKILIMRPTHPIVKILRNYVNEHLDTYGTGNVIYCYDIIYCLQNNDIMHCLDYKYKSYRKINKRMHKHCIDEIERKIVSYNIFIKHYNDIENYTFKTFEKSPEWNIDIDI